MSLEYLAGFFDGEGCITLGTNGGITLSVVNTSLPVLLEFEYAFTGSVSERKEKVNKQQYQWRLYGDSAEEFLKVIGPLLIDKREQANTALEYLALKKLYPVLRKEVRGAFANPERKALISNYRSLLTKQKQGNTIDL